MKRGNPTKPTVHKSCEVQNGMSIPEFLRNYPNILELWLKRPDNPPYFISPTFLVRWDAEHWRGRLKDRGHGRSIWKTGQDFHDLLAAIDSELGLEWPDWRYDDSAEQRRYSERKSRCAR